MKTGKIQLIVAMLVAVTTTAGFVQVAHAYSTGDKDVAKKTFETKKYDAQHDLFNGKKLSWALLAGSALPTTKSDQGPSLAEKATDPTSNLVQFKLQNSFVPESFDSSGHANIFQIQPVIPWKAPWGQLMITRPTILFPTPTADPDGSIGSTSGMGDIDLLHLFITKNDWGSYGLGLNTVFPTSTDQRLGSGKWQWGPAAVVIYTKIPKWQFGALVFNNWSYARNRYDKENINDMSIQWIANYHYKPDWYVGAGDLPWTFNWKNGKQDMPLSLKWGHTTKIGKQPVDMFVQPFYTTAHDGGTGEWGIKFNLTFLFPG
jgi:hypothetical protein